MDPAQGETGGRSLTSKLRARVPHPRVKDKVKNLKNRLPGMKKHAGDDDGHDESSEYDEGSPHSPGPETGYNVGDSTPFSTGKTTSVSQEPALPPSPRSEFDARPAPVATPSYAAAAPPTRPAPMVSNSPRSTLAPSLEEKFQYLDTKEPPPRVAHPLNLSTYQPEQQQLSPPVTESVQKGYSDVPRSSYRAAPPPPPAKGIVDKVKNSVTGAAVVLGDKLGYYNDAPPAPRDPNAPSILDKARSSLGFNQPRDPAAPSVLDKAKSSLGLNQPRDPAAKSTLGLDQPRDPSAPPITEKAKAYVSVAGQRTREYGASAADRAAWARDRVAAQTAPTEHDKALSEEVTQALSRLPGVVREKVLGHGAPGSSPRAPGVVDRVAGAVSSWLGSAPAETAERLQHTFPAHSDYHGQPPTRSVPQVFEDRSGVDERMATATTPAPPPPSYSTVNS